MSNEEFYNSELCKSGKRCHGCRCNAEYRKNLINSFNMESDGDFDCPKGLTCETVEDKSSMPPLKEQAKNFMNEMINVGGKFIRRGAIKVSDEILKERQAICNKCPFQNEKGKCEKCGCPNGVKTHLAAVKCADKENPRWLNTI